MQVFSLFEHSLSIELAISKLEQEGLGRENNFLVPIDESDENLKVIVLIHDSDGFSFIDKGMVIGSGTWCVGTSIGFKLEWGPHVWGLLPPLFVFPLAICGKCSLLSLPRMAIDLRRRHFP